MFRLQVRGLGAGSKFLKRIKKIQNQGWFVRQGLTRAMPPPINVFVKVILKVKDKNKSKTLMPLADTEGYSQRTKHSEQMIGIWTQTLSEANTPRLSTCRGLLLLLLSLILFKCNNAHSLSNI